MEPVDTRPAWRSYDRMAATGEYGDLLAGGGEFCGWAARERDFFVEALRGTPLVLDLGCGPGFPALTLGAHVGGVVGVDASEAMLRQARSNRSRLVVGNALFVRALAEALPMSSGAFGGVAICGALGSVDSPERVLRELRRVCAAEATIVSLEQDYSFRRQDEETRVQWDLRGHDGELRARRVSYCLSPDRIVTQVRRLRLGTPMYTKLLARSASEPNAWPEGATDWSLMTPEDIAEQWVEVERTWRPDTLAAAFGAVGFEVVSQEVEPGHGRPHIFSVFRRRSVSPL